MHETKKVQIGVLNSKNPQIRPEFTIWCGSKDIHLKCIVNFAGNKKNGLPKSICIPAQGRNINRTPILQDSIIDIINRLV